MRSFLPHRFLFAILLAGLMASSVQTSVGAQAITLEAALRLAGASNLDIQIARQKWEEAKANRLVALEQFFPTLTPALGFQRHEKQTQDVNGELLLANKEQFTTVGSVAVQVKLGQAIYRTLAARQLEHAAWHAYDAQKQESLFQAAAGFFDLAQAQARVSVAVEAVGISEDYQAQIASAVEAGLALKSDLFRVLTQTERNRLALQQAREQQRLASARLVQVLHLDPSLELVALGSGLEHLQLFNGHRALNSLLVQACCNRPELKQFAAQLQAARRERSGALYGPLVPNVSASTLYGGLGGGIGNPGPAHFDQTSDYAVLLSWQIGPGGLFDVGRIRASTARVQAAELDLEKIGDAVARQVVESHVRLHSLSAQLECARCAVKAAETTLRMARERRDFGVGVVLEAIQAEQDFTQSRQDYLTLIAESNKAQYALRRAIGEPVSPPEPPSKTAPTKQKRSPKR